MDWLIKNGNKSKLIAYKLIIKIIEQFVYNQTSPYNRLDIKMINGTQLSHNYLLNGN